VTGALDGRLRKADRAGEIAGLVDFDDGQAGVLLVVGAQAAVMRAAMLRPRLRAERAVAGLEIVLCPLPVVGVGGDDSLLHAVFGAEIIVIVTTRCGGNSHRVGQKVVYLTA
jgi:hypothetical protein